MAPSTPIPPQGNRACEECKARKVRCPAEKPACMTCVRHGKQCHYPPPRATGVVHRVSVERRRSLVDDRESRERSLPRNNGTPYAPSVRSGQLPQPYPPPPPPSQGSHLLPSQQQLVQQPQRSLHPPQASPQRRPHIAPSPGPSRPTPQSTTIQSFFPSVNDEASQPLPAHLDEVDFSWMLNEPDLAESQSTRDVDAAMQEHCLWLYFTNQGSSGLQFNIARFYERLMSPDPSKRPHIALINAMCLVICQASPLEFVRASELSFFEQAEAAMAQTVQDRQAFQHNLLDLMRAATLLGEWLWAQCREAEAALMASKACRIALAGAFEQITSSTDIKTSSRSFLLRSRNSICAPPTDHIDLADRIYAFWAVVMLDLASAIASGMPVNIPVSSIRTPLPHPWDSYDQGACPPDRYLVDLFKPSMGITPPQTHMAFLIQATVLLHFSTVQTITSKGQSTWSESALFPSPFGDPSSPATPHPAASQAAAAHTVPSLKLEAALERFWKGLPSDLKSLTPVEEGGPADPSTALMLHSLLCAAKMYVKDSNDYHSSNDAALYQARRIVDLVRFYNLSGFTTRSLSLYVLWVLAAKILIREVKRLTSLRDRITTMVLDSDVDYIMQALGDASHHSPLVRSKLQLLQMIRVALYPSEESIEQATPEQPAETPGARSEPGVHLPPAPADTPQTESLRTSEFM
ncbi:hypothetical protein IAT38_003856 [Cryptococcus sp. DSM 104549]